MQRTLVLVKPDGVQRGLVGEVISRLEARGLKLTALKLVQMTNAMAYSHYEAHVNKPFFSGLTDFITSGPLVAMVVEGKDAIETVRRVKDAIETVRRVMGETDPAKAEPGTIRGDLAIDIGRNVVHGSDSPEAAEREVSLFFQKSEILDYTRDIDRWITES